MKNILKTMILITFMGFSHLSQGAGGHAYHHGPISPLTEAGNGAFATIQEVILRLRSDPKTDWSKVNLEALRQHLIDMNNMTLNVTVLEQKHIKNGLKISLDPNNAQAETSLDRVFSAHPVQLQTETGWTMKTVKANGKYVLVITAKTITDAIKIQGLGYIGVMAWGKHHQVHHWMIASGKHPH